jgi:DNA transformation protein
MTISVEFQRFLAELMAPLGTVSIRNMFGGAGIYCRGVMFGLIVADTLYLKVDDETRGAYESAGAKPFTYDMGKGQRVFPSLYELPAHLLDEPEIFLDWARRALDSALRAREPRTDRRRRPNVARRSPAQFG